MPLADAVIGRLGKHGNMRPARILLILITSAYLVGVAWMTLGPQPDVMMPGSPLPLLLRLGREYPQLSWLTYAHIEFLANIAMFVPIGVLFSLLFGRRFWWVAIVIGFGMTCAIESLQTGIPTRVSDVRDIISNTSGAIIGAVLGELVNLATLRRRPPNRPVRVRTAPTPIG